MERKPRKTGSKKEEPVFPVAAYRLATRDEKYWQKLARMTPEEKVSWADKTREAILALREAADKCKQNTLS